ncbi:Disease resistance protein [Melia azedarach]|uniref:Disease resistance protein n=1 Tax=Melia azedarach TaxID=155640 RepID=A0ACC1XUC4_MELAZ|nr:Disease resistance protein [Melia azedarach]
MGDLVGEALVGAVVGELLKVVLEATKEAVVFKSRLNQLKLILQSVTPTFEEIQRLNKVLHRPEQETKDLIEKLEQGKQLVQKCSKMKWYSVKRFQYSKKIFELDCSIVRFFQIDVQLQQTRDNKEILKVLKEVHTTVKRISGHEKIGGIFSQVEIIRACSVPDPPAVTPGLDVPLKELKRDLFNSEKQVIVISAPGGYGKTTLVKRLCKDDEVQGKFNDNMFFVTFSKTPNVKVMVGKIFQHKHFRVPEFQSDEDAIHNLERLLKEIGTKPILLVLDDVWSGSESLLHKFRFQVPNYKILVTSRSKFPQYGAGYQLKPLNDEAALTLFRHSAILPDGNPYIPDENLVKKILEACKGSPLALTVAGSSLCGQPAAIWRRRVKEWPQGVSIFHSNSDMVDCLKSSLDALNDEAKECYMDLCSFPEDQRIPIDALIDMWMELYESAEDDFFAMANLCELSNRNLVNLVVTRENATDDGSYNNHFVMQHDLLRELTIHQSILEPIEQTKRLIVDISGNKFPKWWLEQKQQPINARLLSITTGETFSSNWYDMQVPEVEVVVLNIRTMKYALPDFMQKMDKLKVLIVTNYGFFPTELTNLPLLGSNLKRIRLERLSVPSFGMIGLHMKNLQRISLIMCNVYQAFQNSNLQISDAFPNLLEINIDYCNDLLELPDALCHIVSLKKLSITNCHKLSALPEAIGKLVNLEMLTLASCIDLSELPDTIENLSSLQYLDISECLSIKELPEQIGKLCSLETLCMRGCNNCELPAAILNLENLEVVKCDEETAHHWENFRLCFKNLKIELLREDINLNWLRSPHF